MNSRRAHLEPLMPVIGVVIALVAWEAVARARNLIFLPPVTVVVNRLIEMFVDGTILPHLRASLQSLAIGYAISVVGGVVVGGLMGMYRRVDKAIDIYVGAMLTAPSLVFAPIFFVIFGIDRSAVVAVIVQNTAFLVIIATRDAVRSVPRELVEVVRVFGARDSFVFRRVVMRGALPLTMAGLRIATGRAIKGLLGGEVFIAVVGLGGVLVRAGRVLDSATVLAILLATIAGSILLVSVVNAADRRLNRWAVSRPGGD